MEVRQIILDTLSGLPVELSVDRDGKRLRTTRFAYTLGPDGSFVRRSVHVELAAVGGRQGGTIDIEYSGIHLEKRGQ